ncbi:MAG: hypothetical protein IPF52_13435 [Saprospiraceae bacterium]|nr:hypothetical protein [Saprospiraceae bacterium]
MENSKNTILPDFKKESPFGYMPYILSLVIGYSLFLVIFLLLLNVDKAKHLVFYDFDRVDPFFSTYLVFIYGFLCAGIFVHHIKTDPLFTDREKSIEEFLPRSLYIGNIILALLPSFYWLCILLSNHPLSHCYSIIISIGMIAYLAMLYFNIGPTFKKINKDRKATSFYINIKFFTGVNRFLAFIIIVLFLYFFIIYETKLLRPLIRIFERVEEADVWYKHLYFILSLALISGFYQFWEELKEKFGGWFYVLTFAILFLSISLIPIGTIPGFDILIFGAIILRVIFFEMAEIGKLIYFLLIGKSKEKTLAGKIRLLSKRQKTSFIVLLFVLFLVGFYAFISEDAKVPHYEFRQSQLAPTHFQNVPLSTAIEKWISARKDNPQNIYILAGQGGGSRAGCAMFSVLSSLDSIPEIKNNILAVTTISGSSNGAAFYLAAKHFEKTEKVAWEEKAVQLYNVDYVTKSLYKLFFTDHYIFKQFFGNRYTNRNESLMRMESKSFGNKNRLNRLKWSDLYSDSLPTLPIFLPVSYNISKGLPAISSPYFYDVPERLNYYSILDQLAKEGKTITLSQSVTLSQMFPMISASAIVDRSNYMDGGVYDNGPFESLDNIYQLTSSIRDRISPGKKLFSLPWRTEELKLPRKSSHHN